MPLIGILISQYWKPLALLALVAAALGYRAVLIHQRDDARAKLAESTAEAAALRTNNQLLGATIDRQNAAVADLKAQADAATNAMTASEAAASSAGAAEANRAEQQGQALIAAPIDLAGGCAAAVRWGNGVAAELSSW